MTPETISVAEARSEFSNLLSQVELLHRRFIIARRGRPKAVLINIDDLARLEATGQDASDRERVPNERPFRPVHFPEGILTGHDFSPDVLKEARRIMWPDRSETFA